MRRILHALTRHLALAALAALASPLCTLAAEVTSVWNTPAGDWTNAANWVHTPSNVGADYPNNDTLLYHVNFGGGEASVNGFFTLESLTMSGGTLAGNATLILTLGFHTVGGPLRLDVTHVRAFGTSIWQATDLEIADNRILINMGDLEMGDNEVRITGPSGAFSNEGHLRKQGAGVARFIGTGRFMNLDTATIEAAQGILEISANGTFQGRVVAGDGAQVRFDLSTVTSTFQKTTFSGAGTTIFQNGAAVFSGITNESTLILDDTSIPIGGLLRNHSNGLIRLRGFSDLASRIINFGELRLESIDAGFGYDWFTNYGLVHLQAPGSVYHGISAPLYNYGEVRSSGTNLSGVAANYGTFNAPDGTLFIDSDGTNFGTLLTSGDGRIVLLRSLRLGEGSTLRGYVEALADTPIIGHTTNFGLLIAMNGLSGPGDLHVANGGLLYVDGTLSGPARIVIQPGGTMIFYSYCLLDRRTIINEGTNIWQGVIAQDVGSEVINKGTIYAGGTIFGGGLGQYFVNDGQLHVNTTNGTVFFDTVLVTNNGYISATGDTFRVTHLVQNSGQSIIQSQPFICDTLQLDGGTFAIRGMAQISNLTSRAPLSLSDATAISCHVLSLANSSRLEITISPALNARLDIDETVTLGGTLALRPADGFTPLVGSRYTILTFPPTATRFQFYEGLELGNGLRLVPYYSDDGRSLEVIVMQAPAPGQSPLTLVRVADTASYELSWPPAYAGFYLQTATNLSHPQWTTLGLTWTNGMQFSTADQRQFFRLIAP